MYCLDCARVGAKGDTVAADPMAVLTVLRCHADKGDVAARRLYFGILWDEGRSILCYRCKRGRPVRLSIEQRTFLDGEPQARPVAPSTPASTVGERATETVATPAEPPAPRVLSRPAEAEPGSERRVA